MNDILISLRGTKSRAEVAKKLGITPQGLGLIERGQRTPRKELMLRFSQYYKRSIDYLFFSSKDTKCIKIKTA